jgi:hypothetical protein
VVGLQARRAPRAIAISLVFLALAGGLYMTRRAVFGDRPAAVHVRWAENVDDARRAELERQYELTAPERTDGRTFAYALTDVSRANIQALVLDPAIEDTHEINRTAYRVGFLSPRLPYASPYPSIPRTLDALSILCVILAVGWSAVRGGVPRLVQWIGDRIPGASPQAVALFRIVFGTALLVFVLRRTVSAAWAIEPSNVISPLQHWLLQVFVHAPWLANSLQWWIAAWGVLFVAGAFARVAFACLTTGVYAWALLYTTNTTYHTISALLIALTLLQWSRWSDAWSIDAWRTRRTPGGTPREYGYTIWAPGFVLGVAYLAAAVAKLRDAGLAWITNGTVKYHFLSDSVQAVVDWGLWIGRHHWASVAVSFAAIAVELLLIVGVFARPYRYRALTGVAALCLLTGFLLLQGLFWPAWWLLLLSFIPWHLVYSAGPPEGGPHDQAGAQGLAAAGQDDGGAARKDARGVRLQADRLARAQVFAVVTFMAVQLGVSLLRLEISPFLSTYDMYATTYSSPQEYEQKAGQAYWVVGMDAAAQPHRCRITRAEADAIAADVNLSPSMARRCFDASLDIRSVSLEATRVHIDWARWERFDEPIRVPLTRAFPLE